MQAYLQPFDAGADLGEQQHGEDSDGQGAGGLPHDHSRGSSSGPGEVLATHGEYSRLLCSASEG